MKDYLRLWSMLYKVLLMVLGNCSLYIPDWTMDVRGRINLNPSTWPGNRWLRPENGDVAAESRVLVILGRRRRQEPAGELASQPPAGTLMHLFIIFLHLSLSYFYFFLFSLLNTGTLNLVMSRVCLVRLSCGRELVKSLLTSCTWVTVHGGSSLLFSHMSRVTFSRVYTYYNVRVCMI